MHFEDEHSCGSGFGFQGQDDHRVSVICPWLCEISRGSSTPSSGFYIRTRWTLHLFIRLLLKDGHFPGTGAAPLRTVSSWVLGVQRWMDAQSHQSGALLRPPTPRLIFSFKVVSQIHTPTHGEKFDCSSSSLTHGIFWILNYYQL